MHADLLRAKLGETKGDEAEVVLEESAPASHQGRLVRVAGSWKFDLASLSDYTAPDDVPVLKAVGAAAADLTGATWRPGSSPRSTRRWTPSTNG